jgi:endonuclease/exonuclease/phosphatase family metal-dependent hydrolase
MKGAGKVFKVIVFWGGVVGGILLFSFLGLVGFLWITEFIPPESSFAEVRGKGLKTDGKKREFTFLSWNIGYAGLGSHQDFFYDGGKMVFPSQGECLKNFGTIKNRVKEYNNADFIFFQEVDSSASRSHDLDEVAGLASVLPYFACVFSVNYHCRFVPVPLQKPMGKVVSGIVTFSRFRPEGAEVHYFNAGVSWPKRLVYLKRCFTVFRYTLDNGKQLLAINTHNSAFDSSGVLRKREMCLIDSTMMAEYRRGNYVVAGGDWNINPRGFDPSGVISGDKVIRVEPDIDTGLFTACRFVFDPGVPSNRNVNEPYKKGETGTTIIDFFVVSPNIEVEEVTTIPMGFECSDHQPVRMRIKLMGDDIVVNR